jgi:predicted transcriptional regulator
VVGGPSWDTVLLVGGAAGAARGAALTFRELTMMEVREVLRRVLAGHGLREIARLTGFDRKTVRRYAEAAKSVELSVETLYDDEVVHTVLASVQERELPPLSEQRAQLGAQRARIERWLTGRPALKLVKVHILLTRDGVNASYATLRRFAIDELGWANAGRPCASTTARLAKKLRSTLAGWA